MDVDQEVVVLRAQDGLVSEIVSHLLAELVALHVAQVESADIEVDFEDACGGNAQKRVAVRTISSS